MLRRRKHSKFSPKAFRRLDVTEVYITGYRDAQMCRIARLPKRMGYCKPQPIFIVAKEEVGDGCYVFCERNAGIHRV
jgi:hypothetical protein